MTTSLETVVQRIEHDLTHEQQAVVGASGKVAVLACPGSGKTKVVAYRLARHIADPVLRNKGIAVMSFTNSAVEEIADQITDLGISFPLPSPHFLGTIDSFFHQHLFRPHGHLVMGCSVTPEIVLPEQKSILENYFLRKDKQIRVTLTTKITKTISLYDIAYSVNGGLDLSRIMEGVVFWSKNQFPANEILQAKKQYAADGLATYSDALYWCYKLATSNQMRWIVESIRSRYNYWILDEAQDTSVIHALVLKRFWDSNQTEVLVVGDPDQAIYEWHKALPTFLPNLVRREKGWQQLYITENRRSSQLICNATHRFRNLKLSPKPSSAVGNNASVQVKPVFLVYDIKQYQFLPKTLQVIWNARFGALASLTELAVVAWRRDIVARIRGRELIFPATEFGRTVFNLYKYRTQHEETRAYQVLERTVSQLLLERPSFGANYELLPEGMTYSDWVILRADLFGQIVDFDPTCSVSQFIESRRVILQEFIHKLNPAVKKNLPAKMRVRTKAEGTAPISAFLDDAQKSNITINTVHQLKGSTLDGIMLVGGYNEETKTSDVATWLLPPNPITGYCEEPRRIAYVAMTRPRKLLVVAIPRECGDSLINHNDWKTGGYEYMQLEDVLSPTEPDKPEES